MKGKIIGAISQIGKTEIHGENGFRKREVILKTVEEFPNTYLIEFTQDNVDLLDAFSVGQNVVVKCQVTGRDYTNNEGKYMVFTTIRGWEIEELKA